MRAPSNSRPGVAAGGAKKWIEAFSNWVTMDRNEAGSLHSLHSPTVAPMLVALAVLFGSLFFAAGIARAEPYMAVREGYKCSQCHVNKTGGGARTDYGSIYLRTRLAAAPALGGNAAVPLATDAGQGRIGNSLTFGADVRTALTQTSMHGTDTTTTFGRQASCDSCHATTTNGAGELGGGKIAEAYIHYEPVPGVASIVYSVSAVPTATTRDFYGLIESLPLDGYVKAGTFKLPNGLQNTWDTPFQHVTQGGYQGLVGFETVYATGVEVGIEPGPFSFSASVTNPDKLQSNPTEKRYFLSASAVTRLGTIGANYARDPVTEKETRTLTSGFAGTSVGRFTVLGQYDQLVDDNTTTSTTVTQWAGLLEFDYLIRRGHNVKYVVEVRDPNASKSPDRKDRQSVIYEPFLTPYLQCRVGYRKYEGPSSTTNDPNGSQYFVEGHFVF